MKFYSAMLLLIVSWAATTELEHKGGFGAAIEYGAFYNTNFISKGDPLFTTLYGGSDSVFFKNSPISRTIGWLYQEVTIEERLNLRLSMAGLFFYVYPMGEEGPETNRFGNNRKATLAIDEAVVSYKWGEVDDSFMRLKVGLFNEKYNKNSHNLGEYLFRSKAYPNLVYNGTWTNVNSSFGQIWGAKIDIGRESSFWKNSFYVTASDIISPPLYDFSLSYMTNLDTGPFEIGLGLSFDHLISMRPSLSSPAIRVVGKGTKPSPASAAHTWIKVDAPMIIDYAGDTVALAPGYYAPNQMERDAFESFFLKDTNALNLISDVGVRASVQNMEVHKQSFSSIKLLCMASLNVLELFKGEKQENELKIYGEGIVLGIKDSPIFYDDINQRIPIMGGIEIPTFGLLDRFSVEVEYWKNPYYNDNYDSRNLNIPIPQVKSFASDSTISPITSDDLKWSVFAEKKIGEKLGIFLQVARDHSRPILSNFTPANSSVFIQRKSWYWLARMQFNI